MTKALASLGEVKACRAGQRVSARGRVLRLWEIGGKHMCLLGDATAITRVELLGPTVEVGRSYSLDDALVQEYPSAPLRAGPGGWHSLALDGRSAIAPLAEEVAVTAAEAYIDQVYKILSGVQRKKARKAGLIEPWRHPAGKG